MLACGLVNADVARMKQEVDETQGRKVQLWVALGRCYVTEIQIHWLTRGKRKGQAVINRYFYLNYKYICFVRSHSGEMPKYQCDRSFPVSRQMSSNSWEF